MNTKIESIFKKDKVGIGKRKESVARVFLVPGTGNLTINNTIGEEYLQYNLSLVCIFFNFSSRRFNRVRF